MNTSAQTESGLGAYAPILRRRAGDIAIIAPVFILLAVYLAFALTPLYQATATILLEPSSVDPKVVTTTVLSYSNQQIEIVQGRVMTTDTLNNAPRTNTTTARGRLAYSTTATPVGSCAAVASWLGECCRKNGAQE